jgi:valyl-tRNA synthetase
MPFLTEELWQRLAANSQSRAKSIALAPFPMYQLETSDLAAEADMDLLRDIVTAARTLRAEMKLDPKEQLEAVLYSTGRAAQLSSEYAEAIGKLAGIRLEVHEEAAPKLTGAVRATPHYDLVLKVPQAQIEAMRKRLLKEIAQLEKNIENLRRQLRDIGFVGRAPEHVVEGMREKLGEYEGQLARAGTPGR